MMLVKCNYKRKKQATYTVAYLPHTQLNNLQEITWKLKLNLVAKFEVKIKALSSIFF